MNVWKQICFALSVFSVFTLAVNGGNLLSGCIKTESLSVDTAGKGVSVPQFYLVVITPDSDLLRP